MKESGCFLGNGAAYWRYWVSKDGSCVKHGPLEFMRHQRMNTLATRQRSAAAFSIDGKP